jgi:hypothetical protein
MSNLNQLLARVKKLEETASSKYCFLILRNGGRYKITHWRMVCADHDRNQQDIDAMMQAKGSSDGSRLWELYQMCALDTPIQEGEEQ